ncbi:MAG: hypothetical protein V4706_02845 [Pseudomonadota bacterium]
MMDMPGTLVELQERARAANEALLQARLEITNERARSHALLTALHCLAVYALCLMVREMLEPAKNVIWYPASWAYKLAAMGGHQTLMTCWFFTAIALVCPLVLMLAAVPNENMRKLAEGPAVLGLFIGGLGYAVMSVAAARLDVPHVVSSYRESSVMLLAAGLLVACWKNSRQLREARQSEWANSQGGTACGELVV